MPEYKGCRVPEDLQYNLDYHVWIKFEEQVAVMGVTDPAQAYSGEVIFIKVKEVGTRLEKGSILATLESAKFMGPMRAPLTGTVMEVNAAIRSTPSLINQDAYANWVVKMKPEKLEAESGSLVSGKEAIEKYKPIIEEWGVECKKT